MRGEGFEALADGTLLLTVLVVASGVVASFANVSRDDGRAAALRYAEETRVALFGTTVDDFRYRVGDEVVTMRNGTSIEAFLRLEVHLLLGGPGAFDFTAANARIATLAVRLVRSGWTVVVLGGPARGSDLVQLPNGTVLPPDYAASSWTYPALDGTARDTRLTLALWINPRR